MVTLTPHLWFDEQAETAAEFYVSLFDRSAIRTVTVQEGAPDGPITTIEFELEGQPFLALDGGSSVSTTPAISFTVACPTVSEVEELWLPLADGGTVLMPLDHYPFSRKYGWLEDAYGISWQLIFDTDRTERTIIPSLLFTGENARLASEAVEFYASIFDDATVGEIFPYGPDAPGEVPGTVAYTEVTLAGQTLAAMDSSQDHEFTFTEGISLVVHCETQEQIDHHWEALSADPDAEQCGWLRDRYGVSWQIVPSGLPALLAGERGDQVMAELLEMNKLDIEALRAAAGAS